MEIMLANIKAVPKTKKIEIMMPYMTAMGFDGCRSQHNLYVRHENYSIDLEMTAPKMITWEKINGERKRRFHSYAQIMKELKQLSDKYNV